VSEPGGNGSDSIRSRPTELRALLLSVDTKPAIEQQPENQAPSALTGIAFDRLALFLGPRDRHLARRARGIEPRMERPGDSDISIMAHMWNR
jgi:hypothetical protein